MAIDEVIEISDDEERERAERRTHVKGQQPRRPAKNRRPVQNCDERPKDTGPGPRSGGKGTEKLGPETTSHSSRGQNGKASTKAHHPREQAKSIMAAARQLQNARSANATLAEHENRSPGAQVATPSAARLPAMASPRQKTGTVGRHDARKKSGTKNHTPKRRRAETGAADSPGRIIKRFRLDSPSDVKSTIETKREHASLAPRSGLSFVNKDFIDLTKPSKLMWQGQRIIIEDDDDEAGPRTTNGVLETISMTSDDELLGPTSVHRIGTATAATVRSELPLLLNRPSRKSSHKPKQESPGQEIDSGLIANGAGSSKHASRELPIEASGATRPKVIPSSDQKLPKHVHLKNGERHNSHGSPVDKSSGRQSQEPSHPVESLDTTLEEEHVLPRQECSKSFATSRSSSSKAPDLATVMEHPNLLVTTCIDATVEATRSDIVIPSHEQMADDSATTSDQECSPLSDKYIAQIHELLLPRLQDLFTATREDEHWVRGYGHHDVHMLALTRLTLIHARRLNVEDPSAIVIMGRNHDISSIEKFDDLVHKIVDRKECGLKRMIEQYRAKPGKLLCAKQKDLISHASQNLIGQAYIMLKQSASDLDEDVQETGRAPTINETPSPVGGFDPDVPVSDSPVKALPSGGFLNSFDMMEDQPHSPLLDAITPTVGLDTMVFSTNLSRSAHVERVLGRYLEELGGDSEHSVREMLKQARCSKQPWASSPSPSSNKSFSFSSMKAIQMPTASAQKSTSLLVVDYTVISPGVNKATKLRFTVPITPYKVIDNMPAFSHYVEIKKNFLALNQETMIAWPYFGDDYIEVNQKKGQDPEAEIGKLYKVDTDDRPRKLRRLLQAQRFEPYVERTLEALSIRWDDLLRFLLEPHPDVGSCEEAQNMLRDRTTYCAEDFTREANRTAIVLSSIAESQPSALATAALLFDNFQKMTGMSLWHVVRRHMLDKVPAESEDFGEDREDLLDMLTCRICLRLCCPYHGEIQEIEDRGVLDSEQTAMDLAAADVIAKDIVHPMTINTRKRVEFHPAVEQQLDMFEDIVRKPCRTVQHWRKDKLFTHVEHRTPFYPCSHPGMSCEDAQCSCFENDIPCEKICGCPITCTRKFQGCACSAEKRKKGQKMVCYKDDRCACFQTWRECDPDLCGTCGVHDVLDPLHRHEQGMQADRCHNASVQRGVAKHTLIGKSPIAGLGLFTTEAIDPNEFLGEYKGEITSLEECERRWTVYQHQGLHFTFTLNATQSIDGTHYGNKTRFINHAGPGKANLKPRTSMVNSVHRIAFYAERKIKPGEELFFDYGPLFPNELVGGKTKKKKTTARNGNLEGYYEVEQIEDETGTLRARKAISAAGARGVARPRPGPEGHSSARENEQVMASASQDEPASALDDESVETTESTDAEERLNSYNISDDMPDIPLSLPEPEEDDDFEPEEDASEGEEEAGDGSSDQDDGRTWEGGERAHRQRRTRTSSRRLET